MGVTSTDINCVEKTSRSSSIENESIATNTTSANTSHPVADTAAVDISHPEANTAINMSHPTTNTVAAGNMTLVSADISNSVANTVDTSHSVFTLAGEDANAPSVVDKNLDKQHLRDRSTTWSVSSRLSKDKCRKHSAPVFQQPLLPNVDMSMVSLITASLGGQSAFCYILYQCYSKFG